MKKLLALTLIAGSATALVSACAPKFDDTLAKTEAFFGAVTQQTAYTITNTGIKAEHQHKTMWTEKNGEYDVTFYDYAAVTTFNYSKWGGIVSYVSFVDGKATDVTVDFVAYGSNPNGVAGDNKTNTIKYTIEDNKLKTTDAAAMSTPGGSYGNNGTAPRWKAQSSGFISKYIIGKNKFEILAMDLSDMTITNKDLGVSTDISGNTANDNANLIGTTSVAGTYQAIVAAIKGINKK